MKKSVGSKIRFFSVIPIAFTILSIANSCTKSADNMDMGSTNTTGTGAKGGSVGPGANEVWIQNMTFTPDTITVKAGTTITWTNQESVAHTVTSNNGIFNSGTISSAGGYGGGGTYTYTFSTPGNFPYHCTIHTSMTGLVIVN